ncbi:hypothetical protein D043_4476A, partial [Vibrio parahaemolyticus EKP-021]
MVTHLTNQNDV